MSTNNIDFDSIDWVQLAGMARNPIPVILGILSNEERFRHASILAKAIMGNDNLGKRYVRDILEDEVEQQHMTSFDKAWIVLYVNRLNRQ